MKKSTDCAPVSGIKDKGRIMVALVNFEIKAFRSALQET